MVQILLIYCDITHKDAWSTSKVYTRRILVIMRKKRRAAVVFSRPKWIIQQNTATTAVTKGDQSSTSRGIEPVVVQKRRVSIKSLQPTHLELEQRIFRTSVCVFSKEKASPKKGMFSQWSLWVGLRTFYDATSSHRSVLIASGDSPVFLIRLESIELVEKIDENAEDASTVAVVAPFLLKNHDGCCL